MGIKTNERRREMEEVNYIQFVVFRYLPKWIWYTWNNTTLLLELCYICVRWGDSQNFCRIENWDGIEEKKQQQHTTAKEVGIRERECFCCYLIISCDTWVNVKVISHSRLCCVVMSYIVYRSRYYPPVSLFGSFFSLSPPSSTPHPHSAQAPPTQSKLGIFSFIFKCKLIKTRS